MRGIAYIPQGRRLFPSLSVDEHLAMLAKGLGASVGHPPLCTSCSRDSPSDASNGGAQLSGGEQQMLAVGRALLLNASLYLMDEPSEGLAPTIVDDLIGVVHQLVREGSAVLIVEQNLRAATSMAERQLIMVSGRIEHETDREPELAENAEPAAPVPQGWTHDTNDQRRPRRLEVHGTRPLQRVAQRRHGSSTCDPRPVMHTVVGRNAAELDDVRRALGMAQLDRPTGAAAITDEPSRPGRHRHAEQRARRTGDRRARGRQARRLREAARRNAGRRRGDGGRGGRRRRADVRLVQLPPRPRRGARPPARRPRGPRPDLSRPRRLPAGLGRPATPLLWRFQNDVAGSGAHGDLNAHIIDVARFITGEEISSVEGAIEQTFIEERAILGADAGGEIAGRERSTEAAMGASTVDDAVAVPRRLSGGGIATFEATRLATGYQNENRFEIHGERGAIRFNFEQMNDLEYYDATGDGRTAAGRRSTSPAAATGTPTRQLVAGRHGLGYEHSFVNQAADILTMIGGGDPRGPDARLRRRVEDPTGPPCGNRIRPHPPDPST